LHGDPVVLENTAGLRNSCCLEPISLFRNVGHFAPRTSESAPFGEPAQPERPRLPEFPPRVGIRHSLRVRLGLPPPRLDPVSRTANHETFREVVVGPTEVGRVIDVTSLRMTSTLPHPGFGDRTYKLSSPPPGTRSALDAKNRQSDARDHVSDGVVRQATGDGHNLLFD
jgi:hypothetical protein